MKCGCPILFTSRAKRPAQHELRNAYGPRYSAIPGGEKFSVFVLGS
jgi:hypothetical protein